MYRGQFVKIWSAVTRIRRFAPGMPSGFINRGEAIDTKPSRVVVELAIHPNKYEPNASIAGNIAKAAVHPSAIIVWPRHDVLADHPNEAGVSSLERPTAALTHGCSQEEDRVAPDEFGIC